VLDEDLRERDDHDDERTDRSDTEDEEDDKASLEDDSPPVETAYERNIGEELGQVWLCEGHFSTKTGLGMVCEPARDSLIYVKWYVVMHIFRLPLMSYFAFCPITLLAVDSLNYDLMCITNVHYRY